MTAVDTQDIPAFRASVLAAVIKAIMTVPGPVKACSVWPAVMKELQLTEEECSLEVQAAIFLLVRHGLVLSPSGTARSLSIGGDTIVTAAPSLIQFTWAEPAMENDGIVFEGDDL